MRYEATFQAEEGGREYNVRRSSISELCCAVLEVIGHRVRRANPDESYSISVLVTDTETGVGGRWSVHVSTRLEVDLDADEDALRAVLQPRED